ncbi:MAG: bifunctional glycosyltransferase/class I SAM-dependent methyltransferase [Actinomycetota bacterium]|jgi:glycosyltransferase involved in cell wall biosynthesis|nr:bifunctional glycosyltransferase/class I SAM-dependent methyltransferase [Actinomycetota bacterium]
MPSDTSKKIGVLVVAYNAASTLAKVLDRIPDEVRSDIAEVIVSDDHSEDSTYLVGLGYQQISDLPITLLRQPVNLGYGGNQKVGYELAIAHGLDIVVMLHGDGQYAPELLPDVLNPLLADEADAVLGSRIMVKGEARRGGMPLYKYVGNRILSRFENAMLHTDLSEFHSGYRAYSVKALQTIPFQRNSDGFNFDTQIIIQLHDAGMRIVEVPISTYYGDEICYVNGLRYAADVSRDVVAYRLQKAGFGDGGRISLSQEYELKPSEDSSHGRILRLLSRKHPGRILDLGCSSGLLAERLRAIGHHVTGVDVNELPGVRLRTDAFFQADLNEGVPPEVGSDFDVVVAADVLEHLVNPGALVRQVKDLLSPNGTAVFCVPNVAHWYPRLRSLVGRFGYDQRGILDSTHLRFFTRRSARRMIEEQGFAVRRVQPVGLPLDVLSVGGGAGRLVREVDRALVAMWPTMFGYQFVVEAESSRRLTNWSQIGVGTGSGRTYPANAGVVETEAGAVPNRTCPGKATG